MPDEERHIIRLDASKFCPLPTDYYKAAFVKCSSGIGKWNQPVHLVFFEVSGGDFKGARIRGYINQSSDGIGQKMWQLLRALLGTSPDPSLGHDLGGLMGRECYIYVELIEREGKKINAIQEYVSLGNFADLEGCRIPPKL